MKNQIIFLLSILLLVSFSLTNADDWNEHKKKYGKTFDSSEEPLRKAIFTANSKAIDEHNALYAQGRVSFTKGKNSFTHLTFTEVEAIHMGARGLTTNLTRIPSSCRGQNKVKRATPPSSRDWRQTPGRVGAIKNQGQCG